MCVGVCVCVCLSICVCVCVPVRVRVHAHIQEAFWCQVFHLCQSGCCASLPVSFNTQINYASMCWVYACVIYTPETECLLWYIRKLFYICITYVFEQLIYLISSLFYITQSASPCHATIQKRVHNTVVTQTWNWEIRTCESTNMSFPLGSHAWWDIYNARCCQGWGKKRTTTLRNYENSLCSHIFLPLSWKWNICGGWHGWKHCKCICIMACYLAMWKQFWDKLYLTNTVPVWEVWSIIPVTYWNRKIMTDWMLFLWYAFPITGHFIFRFSLKFLSVHWWIISSDFLFIPVIKYFLLVLSVFSWPLVLLCSISLFYQLVIKAALIKGRRENLIYICIQSIAIH